MRIFITGSTGLLGRNIAETLCQRGHQLRCLTRDDVKARTHEGRFEYVVEDFTNLTSSQSWRLFLKDVDIVINAAGIFSEQGEQRFEIIHTRAPQALFLACVDAGVSHVIQISALGADAHAVSRFHLTKKAADDVLRQLPIRHSIVQPSLVFSPEGSSTQLFADVARLPYLIMPNHGREHIQPIHIEDVIDAVVALVESSSGPSLVPAVGLDVMTMTQYLNSFRVAQGRTPTSVVPVPVAMVLFGSRVLGMPLSDDSLSMLARNNTAPSDVVESVLGRAPRSVTQFFTPQATTSLQHHFEERFWLPLMRFSIALVWIVTALVSVSGYPVEQSLALLNRVGLQGDLALVSLYGAAALDLVLGIATLSMKRRRLLWQLQIALILGYTMIISLWLPEFWLHPYGPVLKNIPMLALIGFLYQREKV